MQKRFTTYDIARIANVSASTVSRSLNDSPLVAEKTKARVRRIASESNFSFNANARSLITNRTGIVGLIAPDSFEEYQYSLHTALLIERVRRLLEKSELDLIVKLRSDENNNNSIRTLVDTRKVDALLVINPDISANEVSYAVDNQIPVVFLQAIPPELDLSWRNWVFADHVAGGFMATDHLLGLGHRKIACLTIQTHELSFHERTDGYRQALAQAGIPDYEVVDGDGTFEFGYQFVQRNRQRFEEGITAIFSQTDIMALGAIEGLWDIGLRVPQDVAIVAYDDIGFGKDFRPRLTTVHQPRDRIAAIACEQIVELRRQVYTGALPAQELSRTQRRIQPYLVVRESCGAE